MGDFIEFLYSRFLLSDGVSIDTRTIQEGNLYFAISGPNFNANKFAEQALEKGATYSVVDDEAYVTNDRIILVDDALSALQELAKFHRKRFKRPILAITGSNGKTTSKELIAGVLAEKYIVHATKGNYNNHIGVPLTLLHIHPQVEIAIIEMGANHVGEIASYCEVALPTHGMITNIGQAHTETFGGIEGVIRGKSELFDYLRKTEGQVFINQEDPVLINMAKRFDNPVLFPPSDVELKKAIPTLEIETSNGIFKTQILGDYNLSNVGAAIAIGRYFGVPDERIETALSEYVSDNARSQVIEKGSCQIILDAYNANPDSMKAAIRNLSQVDGKKVAILGDMNELENPKKSHAEIISFVMEQKIDELITVGDNFSEDIGSSVHFVEKEALVNYLTKRKFSNTTVLLKASRSIKLETVVENIES